MRTRILRLAAALATVSSVWASAAELSFEERLHYQEKIERVYYNHRTGEKPPFEEALPRESLANKVEKYLLQSALVEEWARQGKGYALAEERLQRELERICRSTNAPGVLKELFAALDNNAYLAKEILVRPILAEKMTRALYQADAGFHRPEREKAERILEEVRLMEGGQMEATARVWEAEHGKAILRVPEESRRDVSGRHEGRGGQAIEVDVEELSRRREELKGTQKAPRMHETGDGFVVERLLPSELSELAEPSELNVESILVRKRPYDEWLEEQVVELESLGVGEFYAAPSDPSTPQLQSSPTLGLPWEPLPLLSPLPTSDPCTPDSWKHIGPPDRYGTAVWTGTEMIVWGGSTTGGCYYPATDSWTLTSTANAPSARSWHTAVWTGTEMIVWGGSDGFSFNTGGRYDPIADSWTATTTTGAPSARRSHTAVWTGTEMIVWGGYQGIPCYCYFDTGGRYNPSTDSWTATSTANAPSARMLHTAVWTGTEMIVWGGDPAFNTGGRYNPTTNSWNLTTTTDAPSAHFGHTAVWTGTEMIVWGGSNYEIGCECYEPKNTGGRYDPATDDWTATSTTGAPAARLSHTAVWTGTEMIVWGGDPTTNTGGRYDPSTDSWTATSTTSAPSARYGHRAVWTGTEMIVWRGNTSASSMGTGGRYNFSLDTWTPMGVPSVRDQHAAVWTGAEMIVWGGNNNGTRLNTGGRYDPATDNWTPTSLAGAPSERMRHTAVWTGTEMIVWGGYGSSPTYKNDGRRYNPSLDTWALMSTPGALPGRLDHTAVWTGTEMIVWGGYGSPSPPYKDDGGRYDPATDNWVLTSMTGAPSARRNHAAVWTGTEMIVWGGNWYDSAGCGCTVYENTGGRYDPSANSWTATSTSSAPTGRYFHTAVWTETEIVVWGGYDSSGSRVDTGGRYDPSTDSWAATSTTGAPAGRDRHTAAWTGAEMIIWGGNGNCCPTYRGDGGRYDPATNSWTATTMVGAPTVRRDHTAVWAGVEMIVWGGYGGAVLNSGGIYTPECPCAALVCDSVAIDADPVCAGTAQTFTANYSGGAAPFTVEWDLDNDGLYDDFTGNPTPATVLPAGANPVGARVTDSCYFGAQVCTMSTTATVNGPTPVITESACGVPTPNNVTLDAGAGYSAYLWNTGAKTRTIVVAGNGASSYSVTVTDGSGCKGSDSHGPVQNCGAPPPPGECSGPGEPPLLFADETNVSWESDAAATGYNLYRGDVALLPDYGDCYQADLPSNSFDEAASPPAGVTWFYLVSAENGDGEGPLGVDSAGTPRVPGTICP